MADLLEAPSTMEGAGGVSKAAASEASQYNRSGDMLKNRMASLVKGAGYVGNGNTPLTDETQILTRSHQAALDLRTSTRQGYAARANVVKGLNPDFLSQFGMLRTALNTPSIGEQISQVIAGMPGGADALKSFTAGNLGIGSVNGLVPFDLLAPSRLIYPVYTVLRNKFPRPAGQGTSRREKVFTGISGSGTGGQGALDIGISELVQSGGNFSNWPLNLPPSGAQTEVDLNVPYKFFGITEQLSWLAQFAGQGFEDISALANLIMLQQMMMGEEYMMIAGTSATLAAPVLVSATARNAGTGETPLTFGAADVSVCVTATNYYGETVASNVLTVTNATSGTSVIDLVVNNSDGALQWNAYVVSAASASVSTATWLMVGATTQSGTTTGGSQSAQRVGGSMLTLQGAVPTTGVHPPTTDTGTGKSTRMEGVIPILSGASAANGTLPAGWEAGYYKGNAGTHLSYNVIYQALSGLWETNSTNTGAYKADPAEIMGDGGDIMRLSNDVIAQGSATNYRLFLDQSDVPGVRVGAAVSEFQNPITRSVLKMVVHPNWTQGTAALMTYQLPQTWTNVANAWEMTCVQDYVSIAWPTIDATYRYSMFLYGALVPHAPMYSGLIQGLQASDVTPFS